MGHLLSSAIKMQGGVADPTVQITNFGGIFVSWEKNGINQGNVSQLSPVNVTISAGDTIKVIADNPFDLGVNIDYFLNGTYVTSYFDFTTAQTPTITSSAGNAYRFDCTDGA
jgi:hypothetical protein